MSEHEQVRSELVDLLRRDQFGPYNGRDEELPENPLRRYLVGILHPQGTLFDEADDDGGQRKEPVTREDDSEPGLQMSNTVAPSSYGLTFACKRETEFVRVFVKAGRYRPVAQDKNKSGQDNTQQKWQREEISRDFTVTVNSPGDTVETVVDQEMTLRIRSRKTDESDTRSVTISVVNEQSCPQQAKQKERAGKCFFQVFFGAEGIEENRPFVTRTTVSTDDSVSEENGMRLLYRDIGVFGAGHGCAVDWSDEPDRSDCYRIVSSFVPTHTVFPMVQPDDLGLPLFSVKEIAESSESEFSRIFSSLPDQYDKWIEEQEQQSGELDTSLRPQAKEHVRLCRAASKRIRGGIKLLEEDETACKAFLLMHQAMLHQIARSRWIQMGRPETGPQLNSDHAWYPFQIAFILQCLESMADPKSKERDLVDLLWFPTGGGKTEAYLGIIAFLIFLRRLRGKAKGDAGGGTVALMRYTLRLLTVDQFYRAALLTCSCEAVRLEAQNGLNDTDPVSIGLWVGGDASPNYWQQARATLEIINAGGEEPQKGNPLKVRRCPWCGEEIGSPDYSLPDEDTPMRISCPADECLFNDGLPVWVTDTDVYRQRPSLIIGTVDKFARIPWVKEAGCIFGTDGETKPPEVIIQDELHLISGPLGTMVGLYETAVDGLCQSLAGTLPKVIASTATIRNAESQVNSLFCRKVSQFPPPGFVYSDSFFACEDRSEPGREYTGVFTPGTSPTTALVRSFGILLHGAKIVNCSDAVRDAYWTLMAYFNSLRELGGASVQVEDDVNDYLKVCADREGDPLRFRQVENKAELTGRVDSTELDEIRENLWLKIPDEECFDVVLATNMISVGLDVPRLGLMAVVGQPKSTSEYIQATSRIGRRHPGLVVTLYNWTRSRDRSHFERFKGYHSRLYSEVEATSVTPFSSRSRDRGLHAVLISLVRHLIDGMGGNSAAVKFDGNNAEIRKLVQQIVGRVSVVEKDSAEAKDTKKALHDIINRWQTMGNDGELVYSRKGKRDDRLPLMIGAEQASATTTSFPTLNSLRNIDPAAGLKLEN